MATNTAGSTARRLHQAQLHYIRAVINWNDAGIATASTKQIGTLPAGALIMGSQVNIETAFNAATTNVLSIGTEATTNTNLVTTAQAIAGTVGLKGPTLAPTGLGLARFAADSPVYALYTQTGTAATAGVAVVTIYFTVPNDILN